MGANGIVQETGPEVAAIRPGDRVVVPFNISCGRCWMCENGLQSQCETTQVTAFKRGARLLGYTHLYGGVPGCQAEYVRVPQAHIGPIKLAGGMDVTTSVLLADVLPTAWQAVEYAAVGEGSTVSVFGLGPIGQMAARIALYRGASRVIGVDWVPERLAMARRHGVETVDLHAADDPHQQVLEMTGGRGVDAGIDAVGTEADSSAVGRALQRLKVRPDRLKALRACLATVRRGGTLSISGVYGGFVPMVNIGELFDRQITIRMGQANVRRWIDDIFPLLTNGDPLGTTDLITHTPRLDDAAEAYSMFRDKRDGAVKVVLTAPGAA